MDRKEAMSSTATLMYRSTRIGFGVSVLIALVVAVFAFFFASDACNVSHEGECLRDCVWRQLPVWFCPWHESVSAMRWLSRGAGCVFAGVSAAVFYTVVCHFLYFEMKPLNMLEYCRIRYRLVNWSLCVALSVCFSRIFINIFVPLTFDTLIVTLAFLTIGLVIRFLRSNRPIVLIADYVLLGVLSALSVSGIIMLLASTLILFVAKIYHVRTANMKWMADCTAAGASAYDAYGQYRAYSGCYSSDSGSTDGECAAKDELAEINGAALTERLRLSIIMFFLVGFIVMSVLLVACALAMGWGMKDILIDWIWWYVDELKGSAAMNVMAVICVLAIAVIFASYNYYRMLDWEHWLSARDVFRLIIVLFVSAAVLLGVGQTVPGTDGQLSNVIYLVPIVIQGFSCVLILMAVVIFLVNLKCRRVVWAVGSADVGADARQYKLMRIPLLFFFDFAPWCLLAISTFYVWRAFL